MRSYGFQTFKKNNTFAPPVVSFNSLHPSRGRPTLLRPSFLATTESSTSSRSGSRAYLPNSFVRARRFAAPIFHPLPCATQRNSSAVSPPFVTTPVYCAGRRNPNRLHLLGNRRSPRSLYMLCSTFVICSTNVCAAWESITTFQKSGMKKTRATRRFQ